MALQIISKQNEGSFLSFVYSKQIIDFYEKIFQYPNCEIIILQLFEAKNEKEINIPTP